MSVQITAKVWADPYYSQSQKSELLIALALADFARKGDGKAWPSIETLAHKARTSVRGAQDAISALKKSGKLRVEEGGGMRGTNAYFLLFTPATVAPPQPSHPRNEAAAEAADELPAPAAEEAADAAAAPPADGCTQIVRNRQDPEGTEKNRHSLPTPNHQPESERESGFEEFWEAYPKKKNRAEAEKAWRELQCSTLAPRVLAAVEAARRTDEWKRDGEWRWVPNPAKWLRAKGWEDALGVMKLTPAEREMKWRGWWTEQGSQAPDYRSREPRLDNEFQAWLEAQAREQGFEGVSCQKPASPQGRQPPQPPKPPRLPTSDELYGSLLAGSCQPALSAESHPGADTPPGATCPPAQLEEWQPPTRIRPPAMIERAPALVAAEDLQEDIDWDA